MLIVASDLDNMPFAGVDESYRFAPAEGAFDRVLADEQPDVAVVRFSRFDLPLEANRDRGELPEPGGDRHQAFLDVPTARDRVDLALVDVALQRRAVCWPVILSWHRPPRPSPTRRPSTRG